jgi:hypothetical protein
VHSAKYNENSGTCRNGKTSLTIGTYENAKIGTSFPHIGAIKTVRITRHAMPASQVKHLYDKYAQVLRESPILNTEHWVHGSGGEGGVWSPSSTVHSSDNSFTTLTVRGKFSSSTSVAYRCVFEAKGLGMRGESPDALVSGDTLTCITPEWSYGYRATVMTVIRSEAEKPWAVLWQRVCLQTACGFLSPRQVSAALYSASAVLQRRH